MSVAVITFLIFWHHVFPYCKTIQGDKNLKNVQCFMYLRLDGKKHTHLHTRRIYCTHASYTNLRTTFSTKAVKSDFLLIFHGIVQALN